MMPAPDQDRLDPEHKATVMVYCGVNKLKTMCMFPSIFKGTHVRFTKYVTILEGSHGRVELSSGVIAAKRHVHLTPEAAQRFGVRDGQTVGLITYTARPTIFQDVVIRVSPQFANFAHLDYDEANACGYEKGDLGRILP